MPAPKLGFKLSVDQLDIRNRVIKRLRPLGLTAREIANIFTMSPEAVGQIAPKEKMSIQQRFESYYIPEPNSGCWLWLGSLDKDGYGRFFTFQTDRAHRYSYATAVAPIPDNMVIDHLCRVRCCVNPSHMRVVTNVENVMCGEGRMAKLSRQTHCKRGHSLENAYVSSKGYRACRVCEGAKNQRYRAAKKLACI